jgi:uncharacterized DUF497 family protein
MLIDGLIWLEQIVDKLFHKHQVNKNEVRQILESKPFFRFIEKGNIEDENMYAAMGQTTAGRYLIVFFVYKKNKKALIISARDMAKNERDYYEKK